MAQANQPVDNVIHTYRAALPWVTVGSTRYNEICLNIAGAYTTGRCIDEAKEWLERGRVHLDEASLQHFLNEHQRVQDLKNILSDEEHAKETRNWRLFDGLLVALLIVAFLFVLALALLLWVSHQKRTNAEMRAENERLRRVSKELKDHFWGRLFEGFQAALRHGNRVRAKRIVDEAIDLIHLIKKATPEKWVSLCDELDIVEGSVRVSRTCLNRDFRFSLVLSEAVRNLIHEISVPPLLIQPVVENAIWHGISTLSAEGSIEMHLDLIEAMLVCTVDDDGVGLTSNQTARPNGRTSSGNKLVTERIDALWAIYGGEDVSCTSVPLRPGTRVIIRVPLLTNLHPKASQAA